MIKIKGIYNGYELSNGNKYCLAEIGNNHYVMRQFDNESGKWTDTSIHFSRVKSYKEYLKELGE